MTFPTGVVGTRKYSDEELKALLVEESKETSKQLRKLGSNGNRCKSPSTDAETLPIQKATRYVEEGSWLRSR